MTRVLWIDCSAGLAGDMLCGALLDAGGSEERLRAGLGSLGIEGWSLALDRVRRGSVEALRFRVDTTSSGGHRHPHRPYSEIRELIERSGLPDGVRQMAAGVFRRLAEAEGRVHGRPAAEVELHEVGSVDALVDVAGACLLLADLGVQRIVASPMPAGSGTVQGSHGTLSVPVPAVVELARGWPVVQDGREGELVTPTGAALVTSLASPGPMPSMVPLATGYGAGRRNPRERANVVRVVLGEPLGGAGADAVEVIEAQVDDMPGELLPPLLDALFSAGAADAFAVPVLMKKGRPGLLVSALAPLERAGAVADAMLRHSSTFGVRRRIAERRVLDRELRPVSTPYGPVRVKLGLLRGEPLHAAPEFEDCRRLALEAGVAVAEVRAAALAAWRGEAGS